MSMKTIEPDIALDDVGDRHLDGAAQAIEEFDLDRVAAPHAENLRDPVAERPARSRAGDRIEVDVEDAAEIGVRAACR